MSFPSPIRTLAVLTTTLVVAGLLLGPARPALADPPPTGAIRVTNVVVGPAPGGSSFAVSIIDASDGTCDLADSGYDVQFAAAGSQLVPDVPAGTYCWLEAAAPGVPIVDLQPGGFFTVDPDEVQDLVVTNTYTDPLDGTNVRMWVEWIDGAIDDDNPATVGIDPSAYVLHVQVKDAAGAVTDDRSCSYLDQSSICPTLLLPVGGSIHISQTGIDDFVADQADFTVADCFMYPDGGCALGVVNRRSAAPPVGEPEPTPSTTEAPPAVADAADPTRPETVNEDAGDEAEAADPSTAAELPRTGGGSGILALLGTALIGTGVLLRRRALRQ